MWWTAQKLKSRGQNTRKRAIEKLGCSEDPRAIVLLAEVLRDQNPLKRDLRIAAVQGPYARGDCPRPDIAALAIARIGDTYLCVALVLWSSERPEKKSQSPG